MLIVDGAVDVVAAVVAAGSFGFASALGLPGSPLLAETTSKELEVPSSDEFRVDVDEVVRSLRAISVAAGSVIAASAVPAPIVFALGEPAGDMPHDSSTSEGVGDAFADATLSVGAASDTAAGEGLRAAPSEAGLGVSGAAGTSAASTPLVALPLPFVSNFAACSTSLAFEAVSSSRSQSNSSSCERSAPV